MLVSALGLLASLGGVGLSALLAPAASAAPVGWQKYTFQTINNLKDPTFNQLLGINDTAHGATIAGYFGSGAPGHPNKGYTVVPPYNAAANFTDENVPGSAQTQVVGINNVSDTVGFYVDNTGANFGFFNNGSFHNPITNPACNAMPSFDQLTQINNAANPVASGFCNDNAGNAHAYTATNLAGVPTFTAVNPPGATSATAAGINLNGDVSGFDTVGGATQGFLFLKGTSTFVPLNYPDAGASNTIAFQVNDKEDVVGQYMEGGRTHGFLYQQNPLPGTPQWQTIDDPNGFGTTTINGINNDSPPKIVGFYVDSGGNTDGFLGTPTTTLNVNRLFGADRIDTAIAISQQSFPGPGSATTVTLSTSQNFPDALAGGPLARNKNGPLLLTDPGSLTVATQAEIQRVLPGGSTVFLLGGSAALSPSIDSTLTGLGYKPMRVSGADRFGTAVQVANQISPVTSVFETTGLNFPDSLASGPAAIQQTGVILLTNDTSQSPDTAAYLSAHPALKRWAVGGPAATADPSATPLVGATRYETCAIVAGNFFPNPTSVGGTTGLNFPDALAAGPQLGQQKDAPLLLLDPAGLHNTTAGYLSSHAGTIAKAFIFGGTAAVTDAEVGQVVQTG